MKSKLFRNEGPPSKKFSEDMDIVLNLDITKQALKVLPGTISQYLLASDSKSESESLESLRKIWPLSPKQIGAVLGVGVYLLQRMEMEDSIDDIMDDLETLAIVDSEKLPQIRPFLELLIEEYESTFNAKSLAVGTQSSALKVIKSITHIIDLRPVVDNRNKLGEDLSEYKPSISTLVPVAILRIRLSGDDDFVFQMNLKTLRILQNELKAIDMELKETLAFVGNEKITLL